MANGFGAIVLAGGGGRRMGGVAKPAIAVGGRPMLARILDAVAAAEVRIVVGPEVREDGPSGGWVGASGRRPAGAAAGGAVAFVMEDPPGGGPVAAIGAAWPLLGEADFVVLVAGDLPLLVAGDVDRLVAAAGIGAGGGLDGAVYVDGDGRLQWLCSAWRATAIAGRLAAVTAARGTLADASLRSLLGPLRVAEIGVDAGALPPYFDCDTEDDIRRAEEWLADERTR